MAVTLQQIADEAGVSRGTVDRALNNRGRIDPDVARKIKGIAKEMNYKPNRAGRALAMSAKGVTIGVVVQAADTPFMKKVLDGTREAREEVKSLGVNVIIKKVSGMDTEKAMARVVELKEKGCNGIAIVPTADSRMRDMIDQLVEGDIPVVTFNTDIEESKRLCFVGQNALQSGRTAAGLMAEIIPAGGKVLMISGHTTNKAHKDREDGFRDELAKIRSDIHLLDTHYAKDKEKNAEKITAKILAKHEDLAGIYLSAAGVPGVCTALEKEGLLGKVKIISNDLTEQNIGFLKEGKITFLLGQDAHRQGYESVMMLFDKLFDGKIPDREFIYTQIVIKTRYNIDEE